MQEDDVAVRGSGSSPARDLPSRPHRLSIRLETARPDTTSARRAILLGGTLFALVIFTGTLYADLEREKDLERWVSRTYQVLIDIETELSNLQEAETGQRGYLLTGNESYLKPLKRAIQADRSTRQALRHLTADNPVQQAFLDTLDPLVKTKFSIIQKTLALGRKARFDAAFAIVRTNEGKQIMDGIRNVLRSMEDEDRRLLGKRTQSAQAQAVRIRWIIGLGSGCLLILLLVSIGVIERAKDAETQNHRRLLLALVATEADQRFLLKLGTALQSASSPEAICELATRMVADHFDAAISSVTGFDVPGNEVTRLCETKTDDGLSPGVLGIAIQLSSYMNDQIIRILASGKILAIGDMATDPLTAALYLTTYKAANIRAIMLVPWFREGQWMYAISVMVREPHQWMRREMDLLHSASEQIWPFYEAARARAVERVTLTALVSSEERLKLALQAGAIGIWDTDPITGACLGMGLTKLSMASRPTLTCHAKTSWTAFMRKIGIPSSEPSSAFAIPLEPAAFK